MAKHPRDSATGAVPLSLALSLGGGVVAGEHGSNKRHRRAAHGADGGGEFVCKTCSRAFGSFQALGGHRTSHLRGRHGLALGMPAPPKEATTTTTTKLASAAAAPASHLCHVCGLGFEMGQALGGHMRRHREEQAAAAAAAAAQAPPVLLQLFV